MYVFVIIRAYTCCTYMHVFLIEIRSVYLPKVRAHAYCHGAVTVALRSPAPAQVSALSPRGCYGKFVARQRKRMQIAKYNHIRSVRLISGSWRQLVQAPPDNAAATSVTHCRDIDLGISRPNCTEIQAQKINANVHDVT